MPPSEPGDPGTPDAASAPDDAASAPPQPPADQAGGQGEGHAVEPEADTEAVELTTELFDALVAERDDYLDRLQRERAELENYRKQANKRIAEEGTRALASFVERMLPVLDALEAAEAHGSTDVDAVASQLFGFLEKEGLERVSPAGEPFDPNVAEAVVHEPADGDDGPVVTEVLRTGYLWNGRVIRPAMVKVAG